MGTKFLSLRRQEKLIFLTTNPCLKTKFVLDSISGMLKIGSIKKVKVLPKVINPLSVSGKSAGEKRLILDFRYINEHLYKDNIKFDDWKCFENYLEHTDGYVFKFDLKSVYHHVDVFEEQNLPRFFMEN